MKIMPKLFKTYRLLTITIFLVGFLFIGLLYYYRDLIFKRFAEVFTDNTYTHEYLKPVDYKIESQWLKNVNYLRNEKALVPQNWEIVVFASGLNFPSKIQVIDNKILVSEVTIGSITVLEDPDYDNSANRAFVFDSGLSKPNGLSFYDNNLYVATETSLLLYKNINDQIQVNQATSEKLIDLPIGGINNLKNVLVLQNGIYVAIGSSCDFCIEQDKKRASIVYYTFEDLKEEIYATGLRNIQSIINIGPAIVVSEDSSKDDTNKISDEINVIRKSGFYGWPYYKEDSALSQFSETTNVVMPKNPINPEFKFNYNYNPRGLEYTEKGDENLLYVVFEGLSKVSKISFVDQQNSIEDFLVITPKNDSKSPQLNDIKSFRNGFLISDSGRGIIYFIYPK